MARLTAFHFSKSVPVLTALVNEKLKGPSVDSMSPEDGSAATRSICAAPRAVGERASPSPKLLFLFTCNVASRASN
jgi:hypothetical protein